MTQRATRVVEVFCEALNAVKHAGFRSDQVQLEHYLGGDLGIDSIEMLEIWYDLERQLGVRVPDDQKRNVYTVREVVGLFECRL